MSDTTQGSSGEPPHKALIRHTTNDEGPAGCRYIFIEYQEPYRLSKVFADVETDKKVLSARGTNEDTSGTGVIENLRAWVHQMRNLDWQTYIRNVIHHFSTVMSQFKHARLCALTYNDNSSHFEGKV
jgi:hypothetical protein